MDSIRVLDCTLRDGGYCNEWEFGINQIHKIIDGLTEANIDIIECGLLTQTSGYNENKSLFTSTIEIDNIIPEHDEKQLFVVLMNYGEFNVAELPPATETKLDGIRVAFHKKDIASALSVCSVIQKKGYLLFIQPMVTLNYADAEFIQLIENANEINPYAFYIVDSFGVMDRNDLNRFFFLTDHNLAPSIVMGYHAHNNSQLAFPNAQQFINMTGNHDRIVDSSVYGMGRGAGNLNTEIIVQYLNKGKKSKYLLTPILRIIDNYIYRFFQDTPWGYSMPNFLSATHNAHPNYALYLNSKHTLTIDDMNAIFVSMNENKKIYFDRMYIENLYCAYMDQGTQTEPALSNLSQRILSKQVLIIAAGKTSVANKNEIKSFADSDDVFTISINHDYPFLETDIIFASNLRRFRELPADKTSKCIVTSNIRNNKVYLTVRYSLLTNPINAVCDNAGLMLIKLLINLGIQKVTLAGIDGYSYNPHENYATDNMAFYDIGTTAFKEKNEGLGQMLKEYSKEISIEFLTPSILSNYLK
jgi:4-hydroxy 2-oxovalerate aldolase